MQLDHLERQRQQPLRLQLGEVCGDHREHRLGDCFARRQVAAMADLEGHVYKGIVVLAVGHAPGVQAHAATANAAQRKHTAVAQHAVDFFKQAGQIGLLFEVVGVLSDKVRHGVLPGLKRENRVDLAGARTAERRRDDLGRLGIIRPTQQAQEHGGVVHLAFAKTVFGVVG